MYIPCTARMNHNATAASETDFVSISGKNTRDAITRIPQLQRIIRRRPMMSDRFAKNRMEIAKITAADCSKPSVTGRENCRLRVAYETKYTITRYPVALIDR